ncbi:hypothetical protein [Hymenobacter psychrotolerans]|uniref:Uncharacterized protein n=1 Tax=Hymenobacter psychrotolerans DSM 18569 TaxID=1121959 RepID=A0A1M7DCL8_9BACT|nr:hypothetical protein [Hymenobacter psychrotolerans]SHL77200.1 hypothetical protein SAMN02746009_03341 [Hymenobacter psychrotolerans DSM 18569]
MHPIVPWLPLLFVPAFGAFWCLVVFLISRMGWSRLASMYAVAGVPATVDRETLTYLLIGTANYKNAARAGITPQGLYLTTWAIFFVGHPPLLLPWSAFGPVQEHTFLWSTPYTTAIRCGTVTVSFRFSSKRLRAALASLEPVPPQPGS